MAFHALANYQNHVIGWLQWEQSSLGDGAVVRGTEFPWRWGRGTISANLDVIWGMSVHTTKSCAVPVFRAASPWALNGIDQGAARGRISSYVCKSQRLRAGLWWLGCWQMTQATRPDWPHQRPRNVVVRCCALMAGTARKRAGPGKARATHPKHPQKGTSSFSSSSASAGSPAIKPASAAHDARRRTGTCTSP